MDHSFWHNAWARNDQPGWQQNSANQMLQDYWSKFGARPEETVFVPLCGRSPDLNWLNQFGHHVIGVDLSVTAIQDFCDQSGFEYSKTVTADFTIFSASGYTLYGGDFFSLSADQLAAVTRVYDRAALVALAPEMRCKYVDHLQTILPPKAAIFTIAMHYDQAAMEGPPFSVPETEVRQHYENNYEIHVMYSERSSMERRGLSTLAESVYRVLPIGEK
ncbi:hypothetical protein AB833_02990 [Chromatiales bacterium (ex Bugula neritina AB1)]|nr:hypothetical protein AB833_02990 [Chromatiales bacterium (ex Bugula neritina AB1)]